MLRQYFWPPPFQRISCVEPPLALAVTKLPEGPAWAYELKFDGYFALGLKTRGRSMNSGFGPQYCVPSAVFVSSSTDSWKPQDVTVKTRPS